MQSCGSQRYLCVGSWKQGSQDAQVLLFQAGWLPLSGMALALISNKLLKFMLHL